MTNKKLDERIDRWCKIMNVKHPAAILLVRYAVKYGYRLAKSEYKKE